MKEIYQDLLDEKYYYENRGGHYFLVGLGIQTILSNREVAEESVKMLQQVYGLEELSFSHRAELREKIKRLDKKIERQKLIEKHGAVNLLKILDEINR